MKFKPNMFTLHADRGILCRVFGVVENHAHFHVINGAWNGTVLLGQDRVNVDHPWREDVSFHCDESKWEEVFPHEWDQAEKDNWYFGG